MLYYGIRIMPQYLFEVYLLVLLEERVDQRYLLGIKDAALKDFLLPQIYPINPDTNVY